MSFERAARAVCPQCGWRGPWRVSLLMHRVEEDLCEHRLEEHWLRPMESRLEEVFKRERV